MKLNQNANDTKKLHTDQNKVTTTKFTDNGDSRHEVDIEIRVDTKSSLTLTGNNKR